MPTTTGFVFRRVTGGRLIPGVKERGQTRNRVKALLESLSQKNEARGVFFIYEEKQNTK